jgi:hypothetical protein
LLTSADKSNISWAGHRDLTNTKEINMIQVTEQLARTADLGATMVCVFVVGLVVGLVITLTVRG